MSNNRQELLNNGAAVGPQGEGRDGPSTFPRYPVYKDSGVEWLGEVPEHWVMGSLKNMAQIRNGRDYKEVESADGEYPVIGSGGQFSNATQYLYEGESVLLGRKGTIDKPLYINGRFWTVDTMFYTEISKEACAKFFYYNSLTIPFGYYSTSTALPSMTQADLLNHPAAIPTKLEQTQIARFLDHETARIDALIEEQQRLIELLKEKRQAVISHAVTKGLDPTVPMKDSGVEWLGEVPAHWVVSRVKNVVSFITSGPRGWSDYINESGEDIFLQSGDMDSRLNVLFDKVKRITTPDGAEGVRTRVREGDVFVCITGANTGRVAVVKELPGISYVNQHLGLLRPQVFSCDSRYLGYALSSANCQTYFSVEQYGLKEGLSLTDLAEAPIMVPAIAEQVALVNSIEEQLSNLDRLSVDAERAVELLTERRSALISAAVTGKIDVRNW